MAPRLKNTPRPENHNPKAEAGDNSAAVEAANEVQFISILNQYDLALTDVEVARGPLKAAQKQVSKVVGLAKSAGVPKWRLEQRHAEMNRPPHENAENILAEARERRWVGIITPEQLKLYENKNTPEEVMDSMDWRSRGYKLGILNRAAALPEGMPARFTQEFLEGHGDGRKSYMLTLTKNVPGAARLSLAEQAAADFKEEHPEYEPGSPEAKKIEREAIAKAKASLAAMKSSPEVMDEAVKQMVTDGTAVIVRQEDGSMSVIPRDEFEMTDEEREQQKLRPSVQEADEAVL